MGKLGNGEIITVRSFHEGDGTQGITFGDNRSIRFSGGDNDTKYHISLPLGFLTDKNAAVFSAADCRKMYMVFAPRFEIVEQALDDGCFLTAGVGPGDTTWSVDSGAGLTGGRYFIGDAASEERVLLLAGGATSITVQRGYESSTPGSWLAGTRMKKLPPISGFQSDVEWGVTISNIAVTGDASLKVGGDSERIEESDARCKYTGFWEDYKYGAVGWPSQWWSKGHAKRTGPNDIADVRAVTIQYSATEEHDLYLGTFLNTDCGKVAVTVDGVAPAESPIDLYLVEYGGTTANVKIASAVPAGNHTVVLTALFDKNADSTGYYFYFDYLWPLGAAGRTGPAEGVSGRVAGHRLRHRPRVQEAPGLAPLASPEARVQRPRRRVHGRLLEQQAAARGRHLSVRHHRVCVGRGDCRAAGQRGRLAHRVRNDDEPHRPGGRVLAGYRQRDARADQPVLRRVGRQQLRDQHDSPHPVQGSVLVVPRPGGAGWPRASPGRDHGTVCNHGGDRTTRSSSPSAARAGPWCR